MYERTAGDLKTQSVSVQSLPFARAKPANDSLAYFTKYLDVC